MLVNLDTTEWMLREKPWEDVGSGDVDRSDVRFGASFFPLLVVQELHETTLTQPCLSSFDAPHTNLSYHASPPRTFKPLHLVRASPLYASSP